MIAVDTSTFIAYLGGEGGRDVEALESALGLDQARLPPVVVTEALSAPNVPGRLEHLILGLPILSTGAGYWERSARLRRRILARGLRAPLADALISQSCIDHDVALLTRDRDFRPFARHCGLRLV